MGRNKGKAQEVLLSIPFQQSLDDKLDIKARSLPIDDFTLISAFILTSVARLSCYQLSCCMGRIDDAHPLDTDQIACSTAFQGPRNETICLRGVLGRQ